MATARAPWMDVPHATIDIAVPLIVGGLECADLECAITVADDGANGFDIVEYFIDGSRRTGPRQFERDDAGKIKTIRHALAPSPVSLGGVLHPKPDDFLRDLIDRAFDADDDAQERAADALIDFAESAKADYRFQARRDNAMEAAE